MLIKICKRIILSILRITICVLLVIIYFILLDKAFLNFSPNNSYALSSLAPRNKEEFANQLILRTLDKYKIEVPSRCNIPTYSGVGTNRAITTAYGYTEIRSVEVYDLAFISSGVLASTLAHELEVHCKQSMFEYIFLKTLYGDKIASAYLEIPAYSLEVQRIGRYNNIEQLDGLEALKYEYLTTWSNR